MQDDSLRNPADANSRNGFARGGSANNFWSIEKSDSMDMLSFQKRRIHLTPAFDSK
jgi:hypothetical protein